MLKKNAGAPGLFLVLFSLLVVVRVTAQNVPTGTASTDTGLGGVNIISGALLSPSGQRIEKRMSVRLRTVSRGDRIAATDEKGHFAFLGVPAGEYVVMLVQDPEFEPFSQDVSVVQPYGAPPRTFYVNVRVKKKAVLNPDFVNVPKPALAHYDKAVELSRKGDHTKAIEELKLAIKEYPAFMLAFNELGVQYLKLNQLQDADEAFQSALKLNPDAVVALTNRGIAIFMMKRYGDAVPILRAALAKNDQSAVGHYFLGQALAGLGQFEEAEKELLVSLELGKEQMKEAHRLLAIIYTSRGAKTKAAAQLEAYLKLAPNAPDAEKLRATIRQLKEPSP
jgi:Tfp pilus assembly protein PilF